MANIFQEQVVAQKPKAIAGEQVTVYVPRATNSSAGIATYDPTYFNLVNGKVYFKTNEADRNPTVQPSLILIEPNGAGGLIYDGGYLKTSLKTINNQSLIKLLDSADGNINLATKSEFDTYKENTDLRIENDEVILFDIRDRVAGLAHNQVTDDLMYYSKSFLSRNGKILNEALNFDSEPESGSNHLLTSGTIYNQFARLGTAAYRNTGTSSGQIVLLDANGKLPLSVMPATAITNTFVVSSQAAMLALNAQEGDVCIRTDISRSYILKAEPASTLSNWQELLTPTSNPVLSVNGQYGVVVLDADDVGAEKKATEESYTITSNSWTALASSEPFEFSTTVTATYEIGNDTEVGIINDQAVLFANYGFLVGSVSGQNVTIYAIAQPDTSVTLKVGYRG